MAMPPRLRDLALTAHVTASVGWLGAVVAYLVLVGAALTREDAGTVRAVWTALEVTGWYAIVPLAVAALLTGLIMSLGTQWGLFRHYWVLFKLLLTVLATLVLLGHMPAVSAMADVVAESPSPAIDLRGFDAELLHAGGGLVVLVVTTVLSVFKPRGTTRYGRRKLHEQRAASSARDGIPAPPGRTG